MQISWSLFREVQKIELVNSRSQAIRYGLLGVTANAAGFLFYLALVQAVGLQPVLSISIVYLSVGTCNYFGNKVWTFRDRAPVSRSALRYCVVQIIGYLANLGIMRFLNGNLGLPHAYVQLFAIVFVALLLFLLNKYVVFRMGP